ncbi:hypothetical protein J6590_003172, partial [Homalodisca vitripennis]
DGRGPYKRACTSITLKQSTIDCRPPRRQITDNQSETVALVDLAKNLTFDSRIPK